MGRIFGTDGVRGIANTELTCELAMNLGRAAAMVLTPDTKEKPRFLVGKDTRLSSSMLEAALAAGLCSVGADAILLGVVPTPAVAHLVAKGYADAGVMISASHNSYEFNGIKFFDSTGYKLSEEQELAMEEIILKDEPDFPLGWNEDIGEISQQPGLVEKYVDHVVQSVPEDLTGLRIAIDCSNGSASATAKQIFSRLGVEVEAYSCAPNGTNINDNCGSTHVENLADFVKQGSFDAGFAFDGDADRCIAVDENGKILDGDHILAILATTLRERGQLKDNTIVATVLSNLGLFKFAENEEFSVIKTNVGDKYVLEELHDNGYNLGGEQSGHIILYDYLSTGDGQLAAVHLLSSMRHSGETFSSLGESMKAYPQVMHNFTADARMKALLNTDKEAEQIVQKAQEQLGEEGRIIVRASGTEPLIRVMIEGQDQKEIEQLADTVATALHQRLFGIS